MLPFHLELFNTSAHMFQNYLSVVSVFFFFFFSGGGGSFGGGGIHLPEARALGYEVRDDNCDSESCSSVFGTFPINGIGGGGTVGNTGRPGAVILYTTATVTTATVTTATTATATTATATLKNQSSIHLELLMRKYLVDEIIKIKKLKKGKRTWLDAAACVVSAAA